MTTRMQTHLATALGLGMVMAVSASAQAPPTGQSPATTAQQAARGTVTATGCLQRAVSSTDSTSSSAAGQAAGASSAGGG